MSRSVASPPASARGLAPAARLDSSELAVRYLQSPALASLACAGQPVAAIARALQSSLWTIESGASYCELSNGGTCVTDGAGSYGNLGHGDNSEVRTPKLVESLLGKPCISVACGSKHTLALAALVLQRLEALQRALLELLPLVLPVELLVHIRRWHGDIAAGGATLSIRATA